MQTFNLLVHYRYVVSGEQEKDFIDMQVQANSETEAKQKAIDSFKSRTAIPFKVEVL